MSISEDNKKAEPHTSKQRARHPRFEPTADGKAIYDDDFIYDATLKITGDFGDDETRRSYAQWLCDKLNASAEARLSKAIDLLKEAKSGMSPSSLALRSIDAFLKEVSE